MINYFKKYWKALTLFICVSLIILLSYALPTTKVSTKVDEKMSITKKKVKEKESDNKDVKTVFVDVKGSVNNPGVYELESDKRVIDAINKAGGLSKNADTINLNLSKKINDEMIIIVYSKVELSTYYKNNGNRNATCASLECTCPDDFNSACISNKLSTNNTTNKSSSKTSGKVSINSATKEELTTLSGIGDSKAEKIISYRNENGNFTNLEDIKKVPGIGDSIYEKIKDKITL